MIDSPQIRPRHLVLVLGDQLDLNSAAFDGFDPAHDAVWMAEVTEEATHVWSHKARIVMFLAAMRHFRQALRQRGWTVHYHELGQGQGQSTLGAEVARSVRRLRPRRLIVVEPGEWRVRESLQAAARTLGVALEVREDRHFLCSQENFRRHAAGRKQLRMEFFYREMRRRHGVLMDGNEPAGGVWNFDEENRQSFGRTGPGFLREPRSFPPDALTREVMRRVEEQFPKHPGRLARFDWPVTAEQARLALEDFIAHRLAAFGRYQDAMWASNDGQCRAQEAYLFHSRLSAALNVKLLDPAAVIAAAEHAYRAGRAPLASAEGFIRQVLGWREYVRGIYWHFMPAYLEMNALQASGPLPRFYWTGETDMNCLRQVIGQTLDYGYAHHIQRLMVTGLFALLAGVRPQAVHEWYLAIYVDAVEWVELPNTLGMSQHGDGGLMASKPYIASGRYIQRMSNYCETCPYDPGQAVGNRACPFTTFYWDFLQRHEPFLRKNPRMAMQLRNLARLGPQDRAGIRAQAGRLRRRWLVD